MTIVTLVKLPLLRDDHAQWFRDIHTGREWRYLDRNPRTLPSRLKTGCQMLVLMPSQGWKQAAT